MESNLLDLCRVGR